MCINRAYHDAFIYHLGQKRLGGEPYVRHPQRVARELKNWGCPEYVQEAGLLHDLIEDTELTEEDIYKKYGPQVSYIVGSVTIHKVERHATKEEKRIYYNQVELNSLLHPYVMVVKLEDRIDNLTTMEPFSKSKKKKYIDETLELLVPAAERILNRTSHKRAKLILAYQLARIDFIIHNKYTALSEKWRMLGMKIKIDFSAKGKEQSAQWYLRPHSGIDFKK